MKSQERNQEQQQAIETLKKLCPKRSIVYCVLRGVSRSGMSRNIDFYAIIDNRPQWITGLMHAAGVVTQSRSDWERSRGVKVSGCGMDMGAHVVGNLSMALYCPEKYDNEAAFSLRAEWI